jgi:NAD(P)H-hydrate epimerase
MNIPITAAEKIESLPSCDVIVDAIIGYSLSGAPRETAARLIDSANSRDAPILSLDTPSGVDTSTGQIFEPAIRATATMTLALPKRGLRPAVDAGVVGELYLADISVPPQLYAGPGLELEVEPLFALEEIVRVG